MAAGKEAVALASILKDFGVAREGALIVHSAISVLSRQGFEAEGMIDALADYMARGNLFMPTMTWRTVTPENPHWDEIETPSHTGVLSEIFRTRYSSARSIHPTHSVAGLGPSAKALLSRHHIDDTPVSANSPYGLLRDHETYILLIGVGLESCTAIHLPEETIAPEIYLQPRERTETYACRDRQGVVHAVRTRRHLRLDRDFSKFAPRLTAKGWLAQGDLQGCSYSLFAMRHLLREVFAALLDDSLATLRSKQEAAASMKN